jgi:hypothetical protein
LVEQVLAGWVSAATVSVVLVLAGPGLVARALAALALAARESEALASVGRVLAARASVGLVWAARVSLALESAAPVLAVFVRGRSSWLEVASALEVAVCRVRRPEAW